MGTKVTPLKMRQKSKARVHNPKKGRIHTRASHRDVPSFLHCHIALGAGGGKVRIKRTDRLPARAGRVEEVLGWG